MMLRSDEERKSLREKAKVYKRRFDTRLKHIKVILMSNLKTMSSDEWNRFVEETKDSILKNPIHFLGDDLPAPEITREVIIHVFNGFLQDIKVRKVQAFRGPSSHQNAFLPGKRS